MVVKARNIMVFDYRQGIIEYSPFIHYIRFIVPTGSQAIPVVKIFYEEKVAKKLKWIAEYLEFFEIPAEITCFIEDRKYISIIFSIMIKDFPVAEFVKKFNITKISDQKINQMDLQVISAKGMEILNDEFYSTFSNTKCDINIGSLDPWNRQIINDPIARLPAQVMSLTPKQIQ